MVNKATAWLNLKEVDLDAVRLICQADVGHPSATAVVWTNVYFEPRLLFSGPCRDERELCDELRVG
jgi:hypothetical protein